MLLPRFLNSQNQSLNGIPEAYTPAFPADSSVQVLTPFEIVRKATLKVFYRPAFKAVLLIGPNATTMNVKVNGGSFGTPIATTNATVAGSDITSTATNGSVHFGKSSGNVLAEGDTIEVSGFPASGIIDLILFEKQDASNVLNSFGILIRITGTGASTALVTAQSITAIAPGDNLSAQITETTIVIKRNSTVLYTHNLQYKATLKNEAGNAADANAGTLQIADGSAYANALTAANTELKYVVGDVLGTYNVEIESELGRKILQKVIVVDSASGSLGSILNLPISQIGLNTSGTVPAASWWNRYKTAILIGAAFLAVSLLGAFLINRASK